MSGVLIGLAPGELVTPRSCSVLAQHRDGGHRLKNTVFIAVRHRKPTPGKRLSNKTGMPRLIPQGSLRYSSLLGEKERRTRRGS